MFTSLDLEIAAALRAFNAGQTKLLGRSAVRGGLGLTTQFCWIEYPAGGRGRATVTTIGTPIPTDEALTFIRGAVR